MNKKVKNNFFVILLTCLAIFTLFLTSCSQKNTLINNVSELRDNVYLGQSESFSLSAVSGYKESPYVRDGKVDKVSPYLIFKIDSPTVSNATYTLSLLYQDKEYVEEFRLNPINSKLTVNLSIEDFNPTTFNVVISVASLRETVTMNSLLTSTTLSYTNALQSLEKVQKSYLDSFADDNGNYQFELSVKLIFKNEKPYWYIAVITGEDKVKALLIDGTSGTLLAIREVL